MVKGSPSVVSNFLHLSQAASSLESYYLAQGSCKYTCGKSNARFSFPSVFALAARSSLSQRVVRLLSVRQQTGRACSCDIARYTLAAKGVLNGYRQAAPGLRRVSNIQSRAASEIHRSNVVSVDVSSDIHPSSLAHHVMRYRESDLVIRQHNAN